MERSSIQAYKPVHSIEGDVEGFRMNSYRNPFMTGGWLWLWITMLVLLVGLIILLILWGLGVFDQFYKVGGTVTDLPSNKDIVVTLFVDGEETESLTIVNDGTFNFTKKVLQGKSYQINVLSDDDLSAIISNGSGVVQNEHVENIVIEVVDLTSVSEVRAQQILIQGGRQSQQ